MTTAVMTATVRPPSGNFWFPSVRCKRRSQQSLIVINIIIITLVRSLNNKVHDKIHQKMLQKDIIQTYRHNTVIHNAQQFSE